MEHKICYDEISGYDPSPWIRHDTNMVRACLLGVYSVAYSLLKTDKRL